MTKRRIVPILTDTHGGSVLGLCNPDTILETETLARYKPTLSETQAYLWECYQADVSQVDRLAGDDPVDVIHVGDICQGDRFMVELMTTRESDQFQIARWNLKPLCDLRQTKVLRLAVGTPVHNYGQATAEILVRDLLRGDYPGLDIRVVNQGLADLDSFEIDYAHHGPTVGARTWLTGDDARRYLKDMMIASLMAGKKPPDLVLRGHYHAPVFERVNLFINNAWVTSTIAVVPPFVVSGEHARKATRSCPVIYTGMVIAEIVDGHLFNVHWRMRSLDLRTHEIL